MDWWYEGVSLLLDVGEKIVSYILAVWCGSKGKRMVYKVGGFTYNGIKKKTRERK